MIHASTYTTIRNAKYNLANLDPDERQLVANLIAFQKSAKQWTDYANYYMGAVHDLYSPRGLTRRQIIETAVWKIAQDLNSRLMVAAGIARAPGDDYRDTLESLIRTAFPTQKEFCEATGLAEDLVSHVLSKRKHLAIDTLTGALQRIGYRIQIVPMEKA